MESARFSPPAASLSLAALILLLAAALGAPAGAEWIDLGGAPTAATLLASEGGRSVIAVTVGGFETTPVTIDGATFHEIALGSENVQPVRGLPALPDVRRSLIIPNDQEMSVRLLDADYVDFPAFPVAPSKGILPRTVDPAAVPYTFDACYQGDGIYPAEPVAGLEPYILRDFRGLVLSARVFQYLPATQTLRVYTRMEIEVAPAGPGRVNVLDRAASPARVDPEFARLYARHFLNFETERYTPVLEEGSLLIITYDAFHANALPLREWKLQKGIPTQLVDVSQVGTTAAQIKAYIQNLYNTTDLAYVILVGDAAQVPTFTHSGGGSDPQYATLAGADNYPDIFVGRLSAENAAHVNTQVGRTIAYERDLGAGLTWPQFGTGIASNQGPGHYGEYDNTHMDYIRGDLLGYGYMAIDQIYDPTATSQMVANALNAGRGIVNYCGHGSTTSWGTTGFSNTHVDALVNDHKLPFILSVACVNGNFTGSTCFGEAWLRATNEATGAPTGAIATYMSSINQSWDPPMEAEDEAIDLLVADEMRTVGGLWYNGSCRMIDVYGAGGADMFLTWIIFGDPSLAVRTQVPQAMAVQHSGTLFLGMSSYDVTVPGVGNALCALYADGVLFGAARTNAAGQASIAMLYPPAEPMTLALTVSAYNKVTYVGDVDVIPAAGPYLIVNAVEYEDGNGDGVLNAGESVAMRVQLRNVGIETAAAVSAAISTESPYVNITAASQAYPDIAPGGMAWCSAAYGFDLAAACPDAHAVSLPLAITGEGRLTWESAIHFLVHAPQIDIAALAVDDAAGNGNFRLDPGESAELTLTLGNAGSYALVDVTGLLTCSHPLVQVTSDTGTSLLIPAEGSGALVPPFTVTIDPGFSSAQATFHLYLSGANDYTRVFDIPVSVGGFYEPVEQGAGGWTHYIVSGGSFVDQWHVSAERNHTPGGTRSWKCGDTGAGNYANLLDAGLQTPAITLNGESELRFWMWMDAEVSGSYPGRAYDGGLVEMSLNGGPWTRITPLGGYPYTIRPGSNPGPFPDGTPVFSGTVGWQEAVFALGNVSGTAAFRFRFGSDGADAQEGWHVDDIEIVTMSSPSDAISADALPRSILLGAAAPNPCRTHTRIEFALPQSQAVSLRVFDPAGRLVRTLVNGPQDPGRHSVTWSGDSDAGRPAGSGVYYYQLSTDRETTRRALILLR